jgi:hypothetical protein
MVRFFGYNRRRCCCSVKIFDWFRVIRWGERKGSGRDGERERKEVGAIGTYDNTRSNTVPGYHDLYQGGHEGAGACANFHGQVFTDRSSRWAR